MSRDGGEHEGENHEDEDHDDHDDVEQGEKHEEYEDDGLMVEYLGRDQSTLNMDVALRKHRELPYPPYRSR